MQTPLHDAIYCSDIKKVKALLEAGANPNCERIVANGNRYSALFDAIGVWPNDTIAETLVQYGANVNYVAVENGSRIPVINIAIYKKNAGMVRLLLEEKADPNSVRIPANGDHYSALFDAAGIWPDEQIAEILIQYGANINYNATTKECSSLPILNFAISKKMPVWFAYCWRKKQIQTLNVY